MSQSSNNKYTSPFDVIHHESYDEWKSNRKEMIASLGSYLITLTENDVVVLFSEWEGGIHLMVQRSTAESSLSCLLVISVLHYFRRSFDQFKSFHPILKNYLSHSNINVCKATITVMRWATEEIADNIIFLYEALELAKDWILSPKDANKTYIALRIIKEMSRFVPKDILNITYYHVPEIWDSISSNNEALRDMAIKIMDIHLRNIPSSTTLSFSSSLFLDSITDLSSQINFPKMGSLKLLHCVFLFCPESVKITQVMEVLLLIVSSCPKNILLVSLDLLCSICKKYPEQISRAFTQPIFMSIMLRLNSMGSFGDIIISLSALVKCLPPGCIPSEYILGAIRKILAKNQYFNIQNDIFGLLFDVLTKDPEAKQFFNLASVTQPTLNFLKVLTLYPESIKDFLSNLRNWCLKGLSGLAKNDNIIITIHIISLFHRELFQNVNNIFSQLSILVFHPIEEIRLLMVDLLTHVDMPESYGTLTRISLYDSSEKVRIMAIKGLKRENLGSHPETIVQLLYDSSFQIRKIAIPLISQCIDLNPLLISSSILVFVNDYISNNVTEHSISRCSIATSLLPYIAKYFVPHALSFAPTLAWLCMSLLMRGKELPKPTCNTNSSVFSDSSLCYSASKEESVFYGDLQKAAKSDLLNTKSDVFRIVDAFSEKDINLRRIFLIDNSLLIEERDTNLFNTIGDMADQIIPYVMQIIPVFLLFFTQNHTSTLYISAITALRKIVISLESRINLCMHFPSLVPSLLALLSKSSDEVASEAIRLLGTIGPLPPSSPVLSKDESCDDFISRIKSPTFFSDTTFEFLSEMLSRPSPSPVVFEAVTQLICNDYCVSLPYLDTIINAFANALVIDENPTPYFDQLSLVFYHCKVHILAHFKTLVTIYKRNIRNQSCFYSLLVLSYHSSADFLPFASEFYTLSIKFFATRDLEFFRMLNNFFVIVILLQHQCLDFYLDAIEQRITSRDIEEKFLSIALKSLVIIVQSIPYLLEASRMLRICFSVFSRVNIKACEELLINLCLFGYIDNEAVDSFLVQNRISVPQLETVISLTSNGPVFYCKEDWFKARKIKAPVPIKSLTPIPKPIDSPLLKISPPQYNNQRKWIDGITTIVISNSPLFTIRCCSQIASQHRKFKNDLFPIAFLSCWNGSTELERNHFSEVYQSAIQTYEQLDPLILTIINLLDASGIPMSISDGVISQSSYSMPLALYYQQRHFRKNPSDRGSVERLLSLYTKMGMFESARGLLAQTYQAIGSIEAAKWFEKLEEWERAIEIYESQPNIDRSSLIRCNARIEQWDYVREQHSTFDSMSSDQQNQSVQYLAWAFFNFNDFDTTKKYLDMIGNNISSPDSLIFHIQYLIATKQYILAQQKIEKGFILLIQNRSIFDGNDANQTKKYLEYSHLLVELQETINLKQQSISTVPQIWQNRLKVFSEESDSWMTLIKTRSLVLSPSDHVQACMKMISVLRKERKWRVIDSYLSRLSTINTHPSFIIGHLKILWARGEKGFAVDLISYFNQCISFDSAEMIKSHFQSPLFNKFESRICFLSSFNVKYKDIKDPSSQITYYKKYLEDNKIDQFFKARLLRVCATWKYTLYKASASSSTSLSEIISLFEKSNALNEKDYRTWAGLAYATSRALSHTEEKRPIYAVQAISSFLRAAKLKTTESLEYLCQMFSILFRYGEYLELPIELEREIVDLPASIVIQIIPQIVVHISHKDENIRRIVRNIVIAFSTNHFEALVFALSVLSMVDDKSVSSIAKEMLNSLGSEHSEVYTDSRLFINGMHLAAVSLCESMLFSINRASHARMTHDKSIFEKIISELFESVENPKCEYDRIFARSISTTMRRCSIYFQKVTEGETHMEKPLWECFQQLFSELEERMKKLESIQLSKISPELCNKKSYNISIPGMYTTESSSPKLESIDQTLHVLNTQQHPRCVHLLDQNGIKWKFLLKGNEDLRLDQRIMQYFSLLNGIIKNNRLTKNLGINIAQYAIIPFAPNAGLVSWVTGADTLQQLVVEFRKIRSIPPVLEQDIFREFCTCSYNVINNIQRYEAFELVSEQSHANELRDILWYRSPSPQAWIDRVRIFTLSTSLMSIAGYVIGLGDRHPSNIMIQRHTGRVIHIDFGESFESASLRKLFPEKVPFRLSRMIVNALEGETVNGLFKKTCQDVLWGIRENQSPIIAQLEIFVHEPIFSPKTNSSGNRPQSSILSRVAAKLSGQDPICDNVKELNAVEQVDMLIQIATDPFQYTKHFLGWCPFW